MHANMVIAEEQSLDDARLLRAANRIISENMTAIAIAHAALTELADAADSHVELAGPVARARKAIARIEGKRNA